MTVDKFRNAPENLRILVFRDARGCITPETVERIA